MKNIGGLLIILALGAAVAFLVISKNKSSKMDLIGQGSQASTIESQTNVGDNAFSSPRSEVLSGNDAEKKANHGGNKTKAADPFPMVAKSRQNLPLKDDPFAPESQPEQAWLDRNGYPNAQQVETYLRAPDSMLEAAASGGDTVAAVMLADRQLRRGSRSAEHQLMEAAANGSSYALITLAGYHGRPGGDQKKAYALSKVAEMLGDYKMPLVRGLLVTQELDPQDRLEAEARALVIYKRIARLRQSKGEGLPISDPRPL